MEQFLILTRTGGQGARNLRQLLSKFGRTAEVIDQEPSESEVPSRGPRPAIWIPDHEADGFAGMMSTSSSFPRITAWARAFAYLAESAPPCDAVWLVEEDVAADPASMEALVKGTAESNPDFATIDFRLKSGDDAWPWWGYASPYFGEAAASFNPFVG